LTEPVEDVLVRLRCGGVVVVRSGVVEERVVDAGVLLDLVGEAGGVERGDRRVARRVDARVETGLHGEDRGV
jgi:hypothetical protein